MPPYDDGWLDQVELELRTQARKACADEVFLELLAAEIRANDPRQVSVVYAEPQVST